MFRRSGSVLAQTVSRWPWWLAGIILTFLGLLAGVFRWKEILAAQGLRLPLSRVFSIFFIGQFFNAFMLGACGGDVARAYYASRDTPGRRTEAASTVFRRPRRGPVRNDRVLLCHDRVSDPVVSR